MAEDKTLDTEKEKENQIPAPAMECRPAEPHPPRNRKFANRIFNLLNYWGLGFVANSTLSLWITYNALPTEPAQQGIHWLKGRLRPVAIGWDKLKSMVGKGKFATLPEHVREIHIGESARSTAELICMAIAGTIMLFPMKWMENSKEWWLDKIDRWRNPDYYKYCADQNIDPKIARADTDEPKQTWGRLLTGRAVGLVSVLGIDAMIQMFNNKRFDQKKWNFDSAEWKAGAWIFDKLPEKAREIVIGFFSRKGISIEGINPLVQKRLLETLDAPIDLRSDASRLASMRENIRMHPSVVNASSWTERQRIIDVKEAEILEERLGLLRTMEKTPSLQNATKRAIFAEQSRLFTKEVSLTLIMAGLVFAVSKTGLVSWGLEKLGFKKKTQHQIDEIIEDTPLLPVTGGDPDRGAGIDPEKYRRKSLAEPAKQYTQKLANEPASSLTLGA